MDYKTEGWVYGTMVSWGVIFFIVGGMYGCPKYKVWEQGLAGRPSSGSLNRAAR